MSDTCIVCLGDLGESANDLPHPNAPIIKSEHVPESRPLHVHTRSRSRSNDHVQEMIAHLLPCGHNLHNECLKPWVERANSCPICRQSFNQVDLSQKIGGPVISSYPVADRTQVAEIDPSLFTDELEEELDYHACPLCGENDNEDHMVVCDDCGDDYHTYCVDLDEIPVTQWFCDDCLSRRTRTEADAQHRYFERRTRARRRRARGHAQATSSSWARVWQSVWDRLNLDLDFPFDEGPSESHTGYPHLAQSQQRREFREWERRFQVAERQGGANRFRETASTLLDHRQNRGRSQQPNDGPESPEEIRAWNAFEKAKEIQAVPSSNQRKRKSATTSPSEPGPAPQPERQLKRPRTRRMMDLVEPSPDVSADVDARRNYAAEQSSSRSASTSTNHPRDQGPSFLQSLLKEVESSSVPDQTIAQPQPSRFPNDPASPGFSSPGASPTSSNHASPRALSATPPPIASGLRPSSPLTLSSKVEPVYPAADFSPSTSPSERPQYRQADEYHIRAEEARLSRPRNVSPGPSSPSRSTYTSPNRRTMSLSAKSDLQKLVSAALKPHYKSNAVNKDQYTDINRNVSRMLYEKAGEDTEGITGERKEEWERIATDEVDKAVKALQQQQQQAAT